MFNNYNHIKKGLSNYLSIKKKFQKIEKSLPKSPTLRNWDSNSIKQIPNSNQKTDDESNIQNN
jgi:hypothetical protein